MDEDGIGFEILAASLRADSGDLNAFLPALATKLQGALPAQTKVTMSGGMFSRTKRVQAIDVDFGQERFHIEQRGGQLEATRQKTVRGIVLKNEPVTVDVWVEALSECLAVASQSSESARDAIQKMVENS
jgi:hypothetical protein